MLPYQEEYIKNCQTIQKLAGSRLSESDEFGKSFDRAFADMQKSREIAMKNTVLLQEKLLPLLDDLHLQSDETLAELETFADALTKGPKAIDTALACQLHQALLSCARRRGYRETVIRELYKLGMARYGLWNMMTGMELPETLSYTSRMRYCFVEASSYLKYFEEFEDDETKGYILRSTANIYLGSYPNWQDKLNCVRRTMQVFTDERFRANAPGLPWEAYMRSVHRQMAGVLPYTFLGGSLAPEDIADVMESAHLAYEKQFEDIRHEGQNIMAHSLLPYYAAEFSCGLITKEELIKSLEDLLDPADPSRYDQETTYLILSLPAYYIQYLKLMPEMIEPRREYISQLYKKLLDYVRDMPAEVITDAVRLYVRQTISVFLELGGGLTYRELLLFLMARFSPEIYAHGYVVAKMTCAICRVLLEDLPSYFEDIPEVAAAAEPEEKARIVLKLAEDSGFLHDIGKINFASLYDHQSRQMLHSEEELLQLHTAAGWSCLKEFDSTRGCADAALGHHRWYDGSDGYPADYQRMNSPYRALVDVLSVADYLDREKDDDTSLPERSLSFEEKLDQMLRLEGKRFSPIVSGLLRDPKLREQLKPLYLTGRREGYSRCFHHTEGPSES